MGHTRMSGRFDAPDGAVVEDRDRERTRGDAPRRARLPVSRIGFIPEDRETRSDSSRAVLTAERTAMCFSYRHQRFGDFIKRQTDNVKD
jgi:hypothetical protein